jgi:hypothetical protein
MRVTAPGNARTWLAAAAGAAACAALAAAALTPARAGTDAPCTAFIAGVSSAKGTAPELVLFNTSTGSLVLDLKLVQPDGTVLVDRPGEITLTSRQTRAVDLLEQIARDLPGRTAPYRGTFTVEVRGPVGFNRDVVILHVAQYFGSRAKPKAAFVLDPLFIEDEPL